MPEPRASKRCIVGVASFCHRSNIITHDEPRCMNDMTPTRACSGACAGCVTLSASRAPRPPDRPPHFRRWTPNELPAVVASHARHRRRDRHRAAERHAGRRAGTAGHGARGHLRRRHGLRRRAAGPWRWNAAPGSAPPSRPYILGGLLFWQAAAHAPARLRTAARQARRCPRPASPAVLRLFPGRPFRRGGHRLRRGHALAPSRCCAASASRHAT